MLEVRLHGRGGQGVVTAAELLALAGFIDGLQAQAFPSFGSERMGAPVVSFCRLDTAPIRLREPILEPGAIVVQDPTLLHHVDVFGGLQPDGWVIVNSSRSPDELGLGELCERLPEGRVMTVPAAEMARRHLGRPIPSAALLGGLIAQTEVVSLDSLLAAIGERFSGRVAEGNRLAAEEAHARVAIQLGMPQGGARA